MNIELRKNAKNDFGKISFKLTSNAVFRKTMETVRNHSGFELVTTKERKKYLMSEPDYHIENNFCKHLFAAEMKGAQILLNKPVYQGLSIFGKS